MTRILVCPDGFKGTLTPLQAAQAIADGVRAARPAATVDLAPMADGGGGTLACVGRSVPHCLVRLPVTGPLGAPIAASYLWIEPGQAVVESAAACGLQLVPAGARDPLTTTTAGVGQLIAHALERGRRDLVVAVGGTATVDGGVGMAQCLGFRFERHDGVVTAIDRTGANPALARARIRAAVDVLSPMVGPHGAARVFGPQKGADPRAVAVLEERLERLALVIARDLGVDVGGIPGAGAGGALGAALVAFCGATIVRGAAWVADAIGLADRMRAADLVITGEGRVDHQTMTGKTCLRVAELGRALGKPVVVLAGCLGDGAASILTHGAARLVDLSNGVACSEDTLQATARLRLVNATRAVLDAVRDGR